MNFKEKLSFEKLMAYAEGTLSVEEQRMVELYLNSDGEANELVAGLRRIYEKEAMGQQALATEFSSVSRGIDKTIHLHNNFSNHLIELNRQLRVAAAVFVLVFSCSFLMGFASNELINSVQIEQHGPYDLALGSKVAP
ncbi:MAG: hypothetical protein AAFZ15_04905 [Bacteroidota bacterium]